MRPLALLLGILMLIAFGVCIGLWIYAGMPVHTLPYLYFDAGLITKFADLVLMLLVAGAAVLPRSRASGGGLLMIVAGLAFGFGLLAALFRGSMTLRGMQLAGTVATARAGRRPG
jgi:hypothetical protein